MIRPTCSAHALPLALVWALSLCACSSTPSQRPIEPAKVLEVHRETAQRYFDLGEYQRAEDQVRKGLDIESDDPLLLLMLGWIRLRMGHADDVVVAEKVFRELAPDGDYRALLGLGMALERKGLLYDNAADAIETGRRVTKSADPEQRVAELRRDAQAAWKESLQRFQQVLTTRPGEPPSLNGLMRVYALVGQPEESLAQGTALLDQTAAEVRFWRRRLEAPDLRADDERTLRDQIASYASLQVEVHLHVFEQLYGLDRLDESLAHLDSALELDPVRSELHSRRAQVLQRLGRNRDAIASIDDYLRLADLAFEHGDIQRAYRIREECEEALAESPGTAR